MDCSAIVLNKLLSEKDAELWARLKITFLDTAYTSLYSAIARHYDKYGNIPGFSELELTLREGATTRVLAAVKLIDEPDISGEVALAALVDQYTQSTAINLIDKFIDKVTVYDSEEIKEEISRISMELDEKTLTSEAVFTQGDILLFQTHEDMLKERIPLGFNNHFDASLGGIAKEEYVLIGGRRGSGKSIVGHNIVANQYENGFSSVLFTIEMKAREINERLYATLANIPYGGLKVGELTPQEWDAVVRVRAGMFEDSSKVLQEYFDHRDRIRFEQELIRNCKLKEHNQIVIVDDNKLTIPSIDLQLGKLKNRFGDKLAVVVVDYINQIKIEGGNQYDWQPQIEVSTRLKDLARKHNVIMVSPYQIDATGEARFAKGILDSADIAMILESKNKEAGLIEFTSTKVRSGAEIKCTSTINWKTLRIDPVNVENTPPQDKSEEDKPKKAFGKKKSTTVDDSGADIPWNT